MEGKTTSTIASNGHDIVQQSPKQNSVISSGYQSATLHSPYSTRKRLGSSSSSYEVGATDTEGVLSPNNRPSRVNITKLNDRSWQGIPIRNDEDSELVQSISHKLDQCKDSNRKRKNSESAENSINKQNRQESEADESDYTRKRRTELDKLLDAGSSSFHFETAKQTAERLGPIHVDVDNENTSEEKDSEEEESLSEAERRRPPGWLTIPSKKKKNPKDSRSTSKKHRLLKKVSPGANSSVRSAAQSKITHFFPKATAKKILSPKSIPPPPRRNRGKFLLRKDEAEDTENESDTNEISHITYVPANITRTLETELSKVDGSEVPVDELRYSFEHTPGREGWFQTYTRQDQGDEILYYPEPKSFPLPYEMPVSTFYPRREKGDNGEGSRAKGKLSSSINSSKNTSVNPSGTATPVTNIHSMRHHEYEHGMIRGSAKDSSLAVAFAASSRLKEELKSARRTRGDKVESSIVMNAQLNHLERKSPRGHASTKSLISAAMGGLNNDNTFDFLDNADILNEEANGSFAMSRRDIEIEDEKLNSTLKVTSDLQIPIENSAIDDCSNDSWATSEHGTSKSGKLNRNTIPVQEDMQKLKEADLVLDSYLFEGELAMLDGSVNASSKKNCSNVVSSQCFVDLIESNLLSENNATRHIRQRQRSTGGTNSPDKPLKYHKHNHKHKHDKYKHKDRSEQMDHLVASNVDQVLLDCLEDELPSGIVAIEGEIPGSSPLELIKDFEGCDSMIYARSSRRWSKPRPFQEHPGTDNRKSEFRAVFGGRGTGYLSPTRMKQETFDTDEARQHFPHLSSESTILKRLLTDGLPSANRGHHTNRKANSKLVCDGLMLPPPPVVAGEDYYSSSEDTASVCSSTVTTTSHSSDASSHTKRKKKRNLTGFPSPKKKRRKIANEVTGLRKPAGKGPRVKLLTAVLTQNAKKAAKSKKNVRQKCPLSPGRSKRGKHQTENYKQARRKKSSLRSSRQKHRSNVEGAESDCATGTDSEEDASESDVEVTSVSRRGRPPSAKNQGSKEKVHAKPKINKVAIEIPKKTKTEWQQAKALAKAKALEKNNTKIKNVRPKKIVVSRKKYAEYKKARLAEAAAAAVAASAAAAKKPSPKNKKSPNRGAKFNKCQISSGEDMISKNMGKIGLQMRRSNLENEKEEGEEESVLADAEDEESEEERDQEKEELRPPGWLTIPTGRTPIKKKLKKQEKGNNSSKNTYNKPTLRNSNLRSKQNSGVQNKSCRLT